MELLNINFDYIANLFGFFIVIIWLVGLSFVLCFKADLFDLNPIFEDVLHFSRRNSATPLILLIAASGIGFCLWGYFISDNGVAIIGLIGGVLSAPAIAMGVSATSMLLPAAYEYRATIMTVLSIFSIIILVLVAIVKLWSFQF